MADNTPLTRSVTDSATDVFNATQKVVHDKSKDPRLANETAARAAAEHVVSLLRGVVEFKGGLAYGIQGIRALFDLITKAKQDYRGDFDQLVSAVISDLLQVDIPKTALSSTHGADNLGELNAQLGNGLLAQLEKWFAPQGAVTGDSGEHAARTLLGFGMNFAVTAGFMAILPEVLSIGHLKDWAEIGEEMQRSLGLGRLNRMAFTPLVRNTIQQPYDRKMRAKYRQDILGASETVRAWLMGKLTEAQCNQYLAEHGFADPLIAVIKAIHTPTHTTHEYDILRAINHGDAGPYIPRMVADGIPQNVAEEKLNVAGWDRLHHLREGVCNEVLSQIRDGFLPATAMDDVCSKLGLPPGETGLWNMHAGYASERVRKRLGKADMLFLYEHGQVTLNEVQEWAREEGYSAHDQLEIELEFLAKTQDFQTRKDAAASRSTASAHARNVAFVTDQFLKIAVRTPTAAELAHWVDLLDKKQRTRADVTTELKLQFEK